MEVRAHDDPFAANVGDTILSHSAGPDYGDPGNNGVFWEGLDNGKLNIKTVLNEDDGGNSRSHNGPYQFSNAVAIWELLCAHKHVVIVLGVCSRRGQCSFRNCCDN